MAVANASPDERTAVHPFVWTRPLLRQLIAAGVVREGDRVELIEGELVVMPVQVEPHAVAAQLTEEALRSTFAQGYHVRGQKPVALGDRSEPEPDIAVVRGGVRDYLADHPGPEATSDAIGAMSRQPAVPQRLSR
jgi:Uma2 family endonuclease